MRTLNHTILTLASLTALLPFYSAASDLQDRCAGLGEYSKRDYSIVESRFVRARDVPAQAEFYEEATHLPDHCLVQGSLGKRAGAGPDSMERTYEIRFELRMPENWNGRFLFEGGGYMDGVDWPAYGSLFGLLSPNGLERGFAIVRTNSGHDSLKGNPLDGAFSYDQQAKLDYAFNALDKVTLSAKDIVTEYYRKSPDYSYFAGCSNGGRQAMLVSQRFPTYFDGVVSGDPSFNISRITPRLVWNIGVLAEIAPTDANGKPVLSKTFTNNDLRLVAAAVKNQCDELDGLKDGIINDIAGCTFDPATLVCSGANRHQCITAEKAAAMKKIMQGPVDSKGVPLYRPLPYDTGIDGIWGPVFLGRSETAAGDSFIETAGLYTLRYHSLTPADPDFDPLSMNITDTLTRVRSTQALNDAEATQMDTFARSNKLIIYNGVSDYALSVFELVNWYEKANQSTPGDIQDWARMFFVPGMGHCGGGVATDRFDPLAAIVDWVENGNAPEYLAAQGEHFQDATRPVCAWPKVARYNAGPTDQLDSFSCK